MAVKQTMTALVPFSLSDSLQATSALLVASTAFGFYTLSRLLAARAAEAALQELFRLASNPVEAFVLAVAAISLIYYGSGYGRAAQLLTASQLRALILPSFKSNSQFDSHQPQPLEPCSPTNSSSSSSRRSSFTKGSPIKDFAAHRLAERRSRSYKHRHRWSIDIAPTSGPRQDFVLPRQRAVSAERALRVSNAPASSSHSAPATPRAQRTAHRASEAGSPRAASQSAAGRLHSQGRSRRAVPTMQRITSGQELVELGRPSRRSLERSRMRPLPCANPSPAPAPEMGNASNCQNVGAPLPANALASAQPVSHPLHRITTTDEALPPLEVHQAGSTRLAPLATSADPLLPGERAALPGAVRTPGDSCTAPNTHPAGSSQVLQHPAAASVVKPGTHQQQGRAAADPDTTSHIPTPEEPGQHDRSQQPQGSQPGSPDKPAAKGSWVYSAVGPLSDWASSTVEMVLRPVLSGAGTSSLQRTFSAPVQSSAAPAAALEELRDSACSNGARGGGVRRRGSLDGASRFCYASGEVAADPSRVGALQHLARHARSAAPPGQPSPLRGPAQEEDDLALGEAAPGSALASVGLDGPCPPQVRQAVTDEHLLQFAAMMGDDVALKVLIQLGIPHPWGSHDSLFGESSSGCSGSTEAAAGTMVAAAAAPPPGEGWESILEESAAGLRYKAWRRQLRGGLYMYRASAVFEGVTPQQLRFFHLDDEIKARWDDTSLGVERVAPAGAQRADPASEWCLHRYRSRFPMPMAARLYSYARRVWHRPSDGGCYMVCRSTDLPSGGVAARAVQVKDFVSCALVRQVEGGAELATAYFEDSQVRPSLAKVAIPRGLWGYILKYDAALRSCMEGGGLPGSRRRSLEASRPSRLSAAGLPAAASRVGGSGTGPAAAACNRLTRLGSVWRGGRWSQRRERGVRPCHRDPPSSRTLLRNMVLATGITVLYDIMRR